MRLSAPLGCWRVLIIHAMRVLCNLLSASRLGMAFVFWHGCLIERLLAILGAMFSDFLDGYLARRYQATSRFGSLIDPITDKIFVLISVLVLYSEGRLSYVQLILMFFRDIFFVLFAVYLSFIRGWENYDFSALTFSKIFTAVQFVVLLVVLCGVHVSNALLSPLFLLGFLSFWERYAKFQTVHLSRKAE